MSTTYSREALENHPAVTNLPSTDNRYATTSADAAWRRGHRNAVLNYLNGQSGRRSETAVLVLFDGLDIYSRHLAAEGGYWEREHFAPALHAAQNMLNLDLGGLDSGTMSRWLGEMFERIGWDSDLNQAATI